MIYCSQEAAWGLNAAGEARNHRTKKFLRKSPRLRKLSGRDSSIRQDGCSEMLAQSKALEFASQALFNASHPLLPLLLRVRRCSPRSRRHFNFQ